MLKGLAMLGDEYSTITFCECLVAGISSASLCGRSAKICQKMLSLSLKLIKPKPATLAVMAGNCCSKFLTINSANSRGLAKSSATKSYFSMARLVLKSPKLLSLGCSKTISSGLISLANFSGRLALIAVLNCSSICIYLFIISDNDHLALDRC